jgi:cytochrome c oxidase subunit 1
MSVQTMPLEGMLSEPKPTPLTEADLAVVDRITGWNVGIGIAALTIGLALGVLQGLEHVGLDLYPLLTPVLKSYYQGLTLHGVLNALVWTTFFICGFFTFATVRSLHRPLRFPRLSNAALIVMVVGLLLAAVPLLMNLATVLYTFYPPLQAHWSFYVGLTLVVVGSWMVGYSLFFTYGAWRKENPGVRTPFIALACLITMVMWQIATLGVAAELLFLILPWTFGWVQGTDPLLARSLFWFFGHPLVYFWLLPAYVSWYGMLPAQTGGKMFSDSLARLVFWLFLLLSTPVGFHHQYTDPGIPQAWKFIHMVLTYGVGFPSLLTAFTVVASLELGARARGGKGWLGWITKLNWSDPSYAAQNLAMILFSISLWVPRSRSPSLVSATGSCPSSPDTSCSPGGWRWRRHGRGLLVCCSSPMPIMSWACTTVRRGGRCSAPHPMPRPSGRLCCSSPHSGLGCSLSAPRFSSW